MEFGLIKKLKAFSYEPTDLFNRRPSFVLCVSPRKCVPSPTNDEKRVKPQISIEELSDSAPFEPEEGGDHRVFNEVPGERRMTWVLYKMVGFVRKLVPLMKDQQMTMTVFHTGVSWTGR